MKPTAPFGPLFTDCAVARCFDATATIQAMLDFEAALARAEGTVGVIPLAMVEPITAAARASDVDIDALAEAAVGAGNLAIPLVSQLTALVANRDERAARYVHWGATSQDAIDTGLVLQLRAATRSLDDGLADLTRTLATLAHRHRATPLAARTLLQHALPTTFGLVVAGWLSGIVRTRRQLAAAAAEAGALQFGGAAGTLGSLGQRGLDVARALAADLDLTLPALPWHAERGRFVAVSAACGLVAGTLGKIARDISLSMQTEVGELREPAAPGRGGSSAMPHKRNPVGCAVALAAAARIPGLVATMLTGMPQEHERGLGGWHAEWETLPEVLVLTSGSLRAMRGVCAGLEVDAARMRANLDLTGGLVFSEAVAMSLADRIGRPAAYDLVERASHRAIGDGRALRDVLAEDATVREAVAGDRLARLFLPEHYLGQADVFIDRALAEADV